VENGGKNGAIIPVGAPERDGHGRFLRLPGPGRGHRRAPKSLRDKAGVYSDECIARLVELVRGADPGEARAAATVLLSFAHGQPFRQRPPVEDGEVATSLVAAINQRRAAIEAAGAARGREDDGGGQGSAGSGADRG
jgi:hypothetical protein